MTQTHFMGFFNTKAIIYLTVVLDGTAEEAIIWWNFVGTDYSYVGKGKFLV